MPTIEQLEADRPLDGFERRLWSRATGEIGTPAEVVEIIAARREYLRDFRDRMRHAIELTEFPVEPYIAQLQRRETTSYGNIETWGACEVAAA